MRCESEKAISQTVNQFNQTMESDTVYCTRSLVPRSIQVQRSFPKVGDGTHYGVTSGKYRYTAKDPLHNFHTFAYPAVVAVQRSAASTAVRPATNLRHTFLTRD